MNCAKPTVNLCSRSECVRSTITFEGADRKPHFPNHGMFKVHRFIFYRDMGRIERTARDALNSAREIISKLKEEGDPMPMCLACKAPVSLPCWYCAECTGEWEPGDKPPLDVIDPNRSVQVRSSYAKVVNTSNSLSGRRTPRCIR